MLPQAFALIVSGILLVGAGTVFAQDQQRAQQQTQVQAQDQEQIYGSQLMTPEERAQFRERMRSATTNEEQERIRQEHHEQMSERAQRQGVILPDEPPDRGMGRGMGPGGGMGPGNGMGQRDGTGPRDGMEGGRR